MLSSSSIVNDVPLSMSSSKSLCIFQTVCLHLDGYDVVSWDHGQTQHSGLSLGESVCNHRTIKSFISVWDLFSVSNGVSKVSMTKMPFVFCEYEAKLICLSNLWTWGTPELIRGWHYSLCLCRGTVPPVFAHLSFESSCSCWGVLQVSVWPGMMRTRQAAPAWVTHR